MRYLVWGVLLLAVACGGTDSRSGGSGAEGEGEGEGEGEAPAAVGCEIRSPAAGSFVREDVDFDVALTGPAIRVELLLGGDVVASEDVEAGAAAATLSLSTGDLPDGEVEVQVRVSGADGQSGTGGPVTITIDNTAPRVWFESERLQIVFGKVTLTLAVEEEHVAGVRLLDSETGDVYVTVEGPATELTWDSAEIRDDLYRLTAEVTDLAGNVGRARDFPIVVAYFGAEANLDWYPPAAPEPGESPQFAYVPANYASVEFHTRFTAAAVPGVRKLLVWATWDSKQDWLLEVAMGQGICPHQGIKYLSEESRSGEIVLELDRADVPPEIVERYPRADQDSATFPKNDDPRTFGLLFGHVAPMDPADHVEERLPVDGHMVLLFE